MDTFSELDSSLWAAADNLRANSKLTSSEYCMPVLGVIFLRHATNRYAVAVREIEADQAAGKMPPRPPVKADFLRRRALLSPPEARYDALTRLPKGTNLGSALVEAMNAVERDFEPLRDQLPKDYEEFGNDLLEDLLRVFDSETLRTATGDVFGRIYEYFLMKFAMQGAQDNGEFFTPPSLVQMIVIRAAIAPLERWTEKEQTKAIVQTGILDHVFRLLPTPPFPEAEKQAVATRVYQHVLQQSSTGLFAASAAA